MDRLKTIDQQAIWVSMSSTERLEQSAKEMITHQSKVSDEGDIDGDRTEEKVIILSLNHFFCLPHYLPSGVRTVRRGEE